MLPTSIAQVLPIEHRGVKYSYLTAILTRHGVVANIIASLVLKPCARWKQTAAAETPPKPGDGNEEMRPGTGRCTPAWVQSRGFDSL